MACKTWRSDEARAEATPDCSSVSSSRIVHRREVLADSCDSEASTSVERVVTAEASRSKATLTSCGRERHQFRASACVRELTYLVGGGTVVAFDDLLSEICLT